MKKDIIIAGPCAAESAEQIDIAIAEASKRKVDFVRVNLWKPRTKPGFEGLGEAGLPLVRKVAKAGLSPGLEVITPDQAELVIREITPHLAPEGKLLLWIGARNQNHIIQKDIAKLVAQNSSVMLMVKNQPWPNEDHWEGIIEHVLSAGLPREQLINCFRGFAPSGDNPDGFRNVPDFDMAMRIRQKYDIPMVFDPSHTGGTVPNVFKIAKAAAAYDFDGVIVEVHHDPAHALTDQKQQITWQEFDELLQSISSN